MDVDQITLNEVWVNPKDSRGQKDSLNQARELGIPTRRKEDWKFFPVDQYLKKWVPLTNVSNSSISGKIKCKEEETQICLHIPYDLHELTEFEPSPGLKISSSSEALEHHALNSFHKDEFFPLINTGSCKYSLSILVVKNTVIQKPLRIIWEESNGPGNGALHPRINIYCELGSKLKIIEDHINIPSGGFVNSLIKTKLEENSHLEFNQVQKFSLSTIFIAYHQVVQERDSVFRSNVFCFSGGMIRNNMQCSLQGKGAETILNGLFTPAKGQVIDNHTIVDHVSEGCLSNENYKGIIFDKGTGIFNGKIFVRPGAQKTRAFQSNKNILIGKNPTVHSKPQLEIWADDVKCTHGATTGRLEAEQLFYLRSRGIDKNEAEKMLTLAFANEIIEKISIPELKKEIGESLENIFSEIDV